MKRARPHQHIRRYKSGKRRVINRGVSKAKSKLGKQKREKGLRFEYRILSKLKRQYPKTTFRSSGSHSSIDVLVREPDKYRIIVARTSGKLSPKEREALKIFDKDYEQVELWYRPNKKGIAKEYIKKANEPMKNYGFGVFPKKYINPDQYKSELKHNLKQSVKKWDPADLFEEMIQ